LSNAKKLVNCYRKISRTEKFEIVEIVKPGEVPEVGRRFLGYDLSSGFGNSLLCWNLEFKKQPIAGPIEILLKLCSRFFQPCLNENMLFDDVEKASFCLKCFLSLQELQPGLFEINKNSNFTVVGVYFVY
jgi:hypothetical protein